MNKLLFALFALATASRVMLPHQQMGPPLHWTTKHITELIDLTSNENCTCDPALLGNDYCDFQCNSPDCGWEHGDCAFAFTCQTCSFAQLFPNPHFSLDSDIFDDLRDISPCCELRIKSILFETTAQDYITGLQITYETLGDLFVKTHRGNSTAVVETSTLDLGTDDEIVNLSGSAGWHLNSLHIVTKNGQTFDVGNSAVGKSFDNLIPSTNFHLVGFGGAVSEHIDGIFYYIKAHPDMGCTCPDENIGNDVCNLDCYNVECAWDLGDCEPPPGCNCTKEQLTNASCDPDCNTPECLSDLNACPYDNCQCPTEELGNGSCDYSSLCNNDNCNGDGGDCQYVGCLCDPLLIGNETCNEACNNVKCKFDGGDCGQPIACEACGFYSVSIFGATPGSGYNDFNQLDTINACCDVSLASVQVYSGPSGISGLDSTLDYNYDQSQNIQSPGDNSGNTQEINLDLAGTGQIVTAVTVNLDEIGDVTYFEIKTYDPVTDTYSTSSFGDPLVGTPNTVELDPDYPVVGFYGSVEDTPEGPKLVGLGVYTRSDPSEGCQADIDGQSQLLGNGTCNMEYYTPECLFDRGDCPDCPRCTAQEIYNDVCDPHCNVDECFLDNGNCPELPPNCTCSVAAYTNTTCDLECNNQECNYDNSNCVYPDCPCGTDLLENLTCNQECNTLACRWDDQDCLVPIACNDCKYKLFDPVGTPTGGETDFNNLTSLSVCCVASIRKIVVKEVDGAIYGIEVTYEVNGVLEPPIYVGGSTPLGTVTTQEFNFTVDDYLIHLEGHYNPQINGLKFTSSQGNVYTAGTQFGTSFVFEEDLDTQYELVGFLGSYSDNNLITIGAYYKLIDACAFSSCDEAVYRDNNQCDYDLCYNEVCGYDWGDCTYPGCPCNNDVGLLFNGVCDRVCNVAECDFDNGACKVDGCDICEDSEIGNLSCNLTCNVPKCNFDGGDCIEGCNCIPSRLGDGTCDYTECYTEPCNFDGGDCVIDGCSCTADQLHNGECDRTCNTDVCLFDNGACAYPGCTQCDESLIGNLDCDPECNILICNYDGGDCPFNDCPCTAAELDNQCLPKCDILACNFGNKNCGSNDNPNTECQVCQFQKLGGINTSLGSGDSANVVSSDHFQLIEACCDVNLNSVTLNFDVDGGLSGIDANYTLDFGSRNVDGTSGTEGATSQTVDLSAKDITNIEATVNASGEITSLTLSYDDGTSETFGTAGPDDEVQSINLNNEFSAIGFVVETYGGNVKSIEAYVRVNPEESGCACADNGLLGNSVCNYPECYTAPCGYDQPDCSFPGCPEECTVAEMFDDTCQLKCNLQECNNNDNGKCIDGCNCLPPLLGNSECQHTCNTEACLYDGGDCRIPGCLCAEALLGDLTCNPECDNAECNWDDYDCADSYNCPECSFYELDAYPGGIAETFDDTQNLSICCQVALTGIQIAVDPVDGFISGLELSYYVDGVEQTFQYGATDYTGSYSGAGKQLTEVSKITVYVENGSVVGLEITDGSGTTLLGSSSADSYDLQLDKDGSPFKVAALYGSFDGDRLTSIGAHVQLLDSCTCNPQVFYDNAQCDYPGCYNELCGFDWTECPQNCPCAIELLFNGLCDLQCNVEECLFDNHECEIDGCTLCDTELTNGECDLHCNTEACNFDNGACLPGCNCVPGRIGDNICDFAAGCYTDPCQLDGGDCSIAGCSCPVEKLWNESCDPECNTPECLFDNGDCTYPGCTQCEESIIGDTNCDLACNISICAFDGGDCEPYPGCQCDFALLGNGSCNQACDTLPCEYDGGDCNDVPPGNQEVCNELCDYFKTEHYGITASGDDTFDFLTLGDDYCCNTNIVGVYIAISNFPVPHILTVDVYTAQNYYTRLEGFGIYAGNDRRFLIQDLTGGYAEAASEVTSISNGDAFVLNENEHINYFYGEYANAYLKYILFKTTDGRQYDAGISGNAEHTYEADLQNKYVLVNSFGKFNIFGNVTTGGYGLTQIGFWIRPYESFPSCANPELIGDGICQFATHYNALCLNDNGDCDPPAGCDCTAAQYNDATCQWACNYEACGYDNGVCPNPGCTCEPDLLIDDKCDLHCNTKACGFDPQCHTPGCTECDATLLDNGTCDQQCNTADCKWDNYACTTPFDCPDCTFIHVSSCEGDHLQVDHTTDVNICCQLRAVNFNAVEDNGIPVGTIAAQYVNDGVDLGLKTVGSQTVANPSSFDLANGDYFIAIDLVIRDEDQRLAYIGFRTKDGQILEFGDKNLPGTSVSLSPSNAIESHYELVALTGDSNGTCIGAYFQVIDVCGCSDNTEFQFNNVCDEECYNPECGYDWNDCAACPCTPDQLLNGTCDPLCNVADCNYDFGACSIPGCTSCSEDLLSNAVCDLTCNNESCLNDNGKCLPGCFCDHSLLANDQCDLSCNTEPCGFDNGACFPGCNCWDELRDGCCDPNCNTSACFWDNGECTVSFGCDECEYVELNLVGVTSVVGYTFFDDFEDNMPCCTINLTQVNFLTETNIVGLSASYDTQDTSFTTQRYNQALTVTDHILTLGVGEHISSVKVEVTANGISYIYIQTNLGNDFAVGQNGTGTEHDFDIPSDYRVVGFKGYYSDSQLVKLGLYLAIF